MKTVLLLLTGLAGLSQVSCGQNPESTHSLSAPAAVVATHDSLVMHTIHFPSADQLTITADEYKTSDTLPWILLCHQARFSRGEYRETAAEFAAFGYNCLAIDQRSGDEVNGVTNETAALAKSKKLPATYLDAEQDIVAALNYLFAKSGKPVILVGSSYSAGLVLKIAVNNPKVKAVLAFSPGEYYGSELKLGETVAPLDKPVFITSSKEEATDTKKIFDRIASKNKTQFVPAGAGIHGSKALWNSNADHEEYFEAVKTFFSSL